MNKELILDMYYAAPELWYMIAGIFAVLIGISFYFYINILKLRHKNYFIKRNEERYAETINASKDGYYIFIYPDDQINNTNQVPIEKCSRRLAVILGLADGINSNFEDVLQNFYKDDIEKIRKYVSLLREDGVFFEDKFVLRTGKTLNLSGARISGADGSVYGDIIWFRDISGDAIYVDLLQREQKNLQMKFKNLENLVDNLPYPVWLRNSNLELVAVNKKYLEFTDTANKNVVISENKEIGEDEKIKSVAVKAQKNNQPQSCVIYRNKDGKRFCFEAIENPFHSEDSLDKISTVGILHDISELDELKHNLKQHQMAHLGVLGALGTAFAVFDGNMKLSFYNQAFKSLWQLEDAWLDNERTYGNLLDNLRDRRLLPEVPDYPYYKSEEQKVFGSIIEPKEDLLYLPDGRSLRRLRAPYMKGGLFFAFEDISDRLATSREYNMLINVQQEILNNVDDAVLIFGSNGRLRFYNQSYVKLWNANPEKLNNEITFNELLDMQRMFFANTENWLTLKKSITDHLFSNNTQTFGLRRTDGSILECHSVLLSDESIMVLMRRVD